MKYKIILSFLALTSVFCNSVQANLILNSSFEDGLTDWVTSGNAATRTSNPSAYDGQSYLYGSNTPYFSVYQDFDLLSLGYEGNDIDNNFYGLYFGGWQSGWNSHPDYGQIQLEIFDFSMNSLELYSLAEFTSNHQWVYQSDEASLMEGARFLRYSFTGTRNEGNNNDAYLDAAFLELTSPAVEKSLQQVSEPTTLAIIILGLFSLVSRRFLK